MIYFKNNFGIQHISIIHYKILKGEWLVEFTPVSPSNIFWKILWSQRYHHGNQDIIGLTNRTLDTPILVNHKSGQGSTQTVVLWPQASKNSQKWLQANKKKLQLVLQGQLTFGGIWINKFPHKNIRNIFEINEDKINKNKCCLWFLCKDFFF